jgi:glycosyltransferase involved in cell wall biosynthesis
MKITYVTTYDASNIHAWSGSGYHILQALQRSGFQTETIGSLTDKATFFYRIKKVLYSKILSKNYHRDREPALLKHYAAQVERIMASGSCDIVFSPGSLPIAYLRSEKPIVFWTDATFAGMVDFYPQFSNLCAETIRNGNKMEQLALSNCRIAIYSSEWAASTAIQNYDVDPAKIKVVPFGANVVCNRNLQDIDLIINNKNFDTCKLLFVGVDWFRKGGDFALAVADLLNQRGIRTELHIVGCNPSGRMPDFVIKHGYVSKKTEESRVFLDKLMSESHFLILPTIADCVPVVFAEACSFGLPSLATNVGGIPTAIQNGKSGQTFPLGENPEKYCDYIESLMSSKQEYNKLALSSFREYVERLNWSSAGKKVYDLIEEFSG